MSLRDSSSQATKMISRISVNSTWISMSFFPKTASPSTAWLAADKVPCRVARCIKLTTPRPPDIRGQRVSTSNRSPSVRGRPPRANAAHRTPLTHPLPQTRVSNRATFSQSHFLFLILTVVVRDIDPEKCFPRFYTKWQRSRVSISTSRTSYTRVPAASSFSSSTAFFCFTLLFCHILHLERRCRDTKESRS